MLFRFCFTSMILCCFLSQVAAQHTFSIVAVDSLTGEVGSAGATCGDSIIWPGTPGAYIISDVLPGQGAIHTQSYWNASNQANARIRMQAGDSPEAIMNWLQQNDIANDPSIRQYGAVDYNGGSPRSAAFTGANCFDYKNHIIGPGYAIQGNILLGQAILDSMESRYLRTPGDLAEKLMAAMQGANVIGADTRCTPEGTSSLSAFIRVAKPSDRADSLYLDINVAGTATGVEPIDVLQQRFDRWKMTLSVSELPFSFEISPQPTRDIINIRIHRQQLDTWKICDMWGRQMLQGSYQDVIQIYTADWEAGLYHISFWKNDQLLGSEKILKQ